MSEGKKLNTDHFADANEMVGNGKWGDALREAWPYIAVLLVIFGFVVLLMTTFFWTDVKTITRWPVTLVSAVLFYVALENKEPVRFFYFYAVGLAAALWV